MSEGDRWFRVNTTWAQTEWLAVLSPGARLAWIELLGYVKAHGFDGRVKAVTRVVVTRLFNLPADDFWAMLEAGGKHGAILVSDSEWVVTKWPEYQGDPTTAQRSRRYREKRKAVTRVARVVTPVTATETETETKTRERVGARASKRCPPDWQPSEEHHALAIEHGASLTAEVEKFRDHTYRDPRSDWDATFRNWLRRIEAPSSNGGQKAGRNPLLMTPAEVKAEYGH